MKRGKPSRRCFLNDGNSKKKKYWCWKTAAPGALWQLSQASWGLPPFKNQIPVLLLHWITCGCSRNLAFCGGSVFPQNEWSQDCDLRGFFHINEKPWNRGMGWRGSVWGLGGGRMEDFGKWSQWARSEEHSEDDWKNHLGKNLLGVVGSW